MKIFLSLAKLYLSSFYNLPDFSVRKKLDRRGLIKLIGIVVLAIFVIANFGFMFVSMNMIMYEGLAPLGLQQYVLLNAVITASVLTLVIGFLTALSTYFLNEMELHFLAMPIPPRALLAAKFTAVYAAEAGLSLFVIVSSMVIFGIKEQVPIMFYVWGGLAGLLIPLPVLALVYLIQIPLLSSARFLKNKQVILIIGGIIGLGCGIGFNVYYQGIMMRVNDAIWLADSAGPNSILAQLGRAWPPALLTWQALANPLSLQAVVSFSLLLILCLSFPIILVALLGPAYVKSLIGFNEVHIKKLGGKAGAEFFRQRFKKGHAFWSLVKRELAMMNREPMYFLNGPFIIVMLPVLLGIMFFVQRDAFMQDESMQMLQSLLASGSGAVVLALGGAFLGSSTSICCTSLSRDAKLLPFIKGLPIAAQQYCLAKLVHGLIFAVFGVVVMAVIFGIFLPIPPADLLAGSFVGLALSGLFNLLGLILDTANPRLRWDNPIAALKQNPNSVIVILAVMGTAGLIGYLSFRYMINGWLFALLFGVIPLAIFAVLLLWYPRFAVRRVEALEV